MSLKKMLEQITAFHMNEMDQVQLDEFKTMMAKDGAKLILAADHLSKLVTTADKNGVVDYVEDDQLLKESKCILEGLNVDVEFESFDLEEVIFYFTLNLATSLSCPACEPLQDAIHLMGTDNLFEWMKEVSIEYGHAELDGNYDDLDDEEYSLARDLFFNEQIKSKFDVDVISLIDSYIEASEEPIERPKIRVITSGGDGEVPEFMKEIISALDNFCEKPPMSSGNQPLKIVEAGPLETATYFNDVDGIHSAPVLLKTNSSKLVH